MTPLRQRMMDDLRLRNYSDRTIKAYLRCVSNFARHFGKSPDELGPGHIREYQLYLVKQKQCSWAVFNQTVCALRFFYNTTLGCKEMIEEIPYPRFEKRLPVVLSQTEVATLLQAVKNLKHQALLTTIYATGLRVSEVTNLEVSDIDSNRMIIQVRQGKGRKDRFVMLSPNLLTLLREYWKAYHPRHWLFPGQNPSRPLLDGQQAYSTLLDRRSYLDYSAILEGAVEVLTNDEDLRSRLAERLRYVIVDEYQDVNPIQEAIVWSLHELGAMICVVGDDDQTIYQWRGSDVENILTFDSRYPEVDRVSLEENFRSSDGVVETARDFIAQNTTRLPKAMKPTNAQSYEQGDIVALSFDSPDEEARYIAETVQTLRGVAIREGDKERGISWSDMAVLLRSVKANA